MNLYLFYILFAIGAVAIYTAIAFGWMKWFERREHPRTAWGCARRARRLARHGRVVTLVGEFLYWNARHLRAAQYSLADQDLTYTITDSYYRTIRGLGLSDTEIDSIARREMLYR